MSHGYLRNILIRNILLLLGTVWLFMACSPPVPPERDLLIGTATTGGTFYPVGVAIANLVTQHSEEEKKILASAITSSGSAENIAMLINDEIQIGILQGLFASMAWNGSGVYEQRPVRNLRGLTMLWENVEQIIVVRALVKSGTIDDLRGQKGRRFSVGSRWSGSEISASTIMRALGIEPDIDFDAVNLGFGPSADALTNRLISGFFLGAGIPTGAISQTYATMGSQQVSMLSVSDAQLQRLRQAYPVWDRFIIPAETYPGQKEPVATIAQYNVLVSHTDMSEEVAYQVTRILWANLDALQRQHASTRSMSLERALHDMPLPLHPGAIRYYREAGIAIPSHLIPPEYQDSPHP